MICHLRSGCLSQDVTRGLLGVSRVARLQTIGIPSSRPFGLFLRNLNYGTITSTPHYLLDSHDLVAYFKSLNSNLVNC